MTDKEARRIIIQNTESLKANPLVTVDNCLYEAFDRAIQALEQQPCEDTEVIKVSKGAVKARQGRYVIYDVDWLKENFYTTEEKIYGQPKQPCEDCISREAVRKVLSNEVFELMKLHTVNPEDNPKADAMAHGVNWSLNTLMDLPSVTPTSEDIKEAYLKGYDYGVKDWFKSKTQPCEDCISRKAVLDTIGNVPDYDDGMVWEALSHAQRDVALLPSVTPHCGAEMSGGGEDGNSN